MGVWELELLKEYWAIFVGAVALIVWLVRLEGAVKSVAKDNRALWRQRAEDLEATRTARTETNALLHKLDAKLDAAFSEVRGDIKTLLQRDHK